jgi:hypothetical protein
MENLSYPGICEITILFTITLTIILNSVVDRERYAQVIITDCITKNVGIHGAVW